MNVILWWPVQVTLGAAVLALVAAIVARAFPTRPALAHALWLIVLIKFITPPVLTWPWRPVIDADATVPIAAVTVNRQAIESPARRVNDLRHIDLFEQVAVPAALPHETPLDIAPAPSLASDAVPIMLPAPLKEADERGSMPVLVDEPRAVVYAPWNRAIGAMWLAGAVVVLLWQVQRIVRYRRIVAAAAPAPAGLVDEVERLAAKMGVRPPAVVVSDRATSPFVWCCPIARLIWPLSLSSPAQAARFRGVIAHELAHLRRRDHWVAWIELLVGVAWWWNPLVWLARRRLREAAEQACDAKALEALDGSRRQYAELFLELSCAPPQPHAPAPALGAAASVRRTFEKRLMLMLTERVSSQLSWRGLLVVAALALLALPGFSMGQAPPLSPTPLPSPDDAPIAPVPEFPALPEAPLGVTTPALPDVPMAAAPPLAPTPVVAPELPATGPSLLSKATPPSTDSPSASPVVEAPGDPFAFPQPAAAQPPAAEIPSAPLPSISSFPPTNQPLGLPSIAQPGVHEPQADASLNERLSRLEAAVSRLAELLSQQPAIASRAVDPATGRGGRTMKPANPRPVVAEAPPTAATVEKRPEATPASSAGASPRGLESLDLVALSTAYADALGEVKLAERTLSRLKGHEATIGHAEIDSAEIHLETAQRKQKVLTIIVRLALQGAKAEYEYAVRLHEKGYASESAALSARTKLEILEAILQ